MESKMLTRIQALLAKAESTEHEAERASYLAKAQELMVNHAITEGMLAAAGNRAPEDVIEMQRVFTDAKGTLLIKAKRELFWSLADMNRCKIVLTGANGRDATMIYGYRSDLHFVNMMYASILVQLERAMASARPSGSTRGWDTSFAHSYVRRVVSRLRVAQDGQMLRGDMTPGNALVLRDRASEVKAHLDREHGNLRKTRMATSTRDARAFASGVEAGSRADIGGRKLDHGHRAIEN